MTSKADELRAKRERLKAAAQHAGVTAAPPEAVADSLPDPAPEPAAKPARRTPAAEKPLVKDVRLTVDLSPARYRDLQNWLNESAIRLGRSRVTKQDALAALVALLLRDSRTEQLVLAEIRDSQ
jgi:hypothetical protein